jgi:FkbH-like protein
MEATIEEIGPSNLERIVTMLGKTNQFNLTTQRYSRAEVEAMLELPGSILLALRLRDKFGDQGIVGLIFALPTGNGLTLGVDTFLVSCRALGRGVEDALWAAMVDRAHREGYRRIEAEYRVTAKNGMVADLYDRLGLERIEQNSSLIRYLLEPVERHAFPAWIVWTVSNNEP